MVLVERPCIEDGAEPELIEGPPGPTRSDQTLRQRGLGVPFSDILGAKARVPPAGGVRITDTRGWTKEQLLEAIQAAERDELGFNEAPRGARGWWEVFRIENQERLDLIYRLVEELRNRGAKIQDFFQVYIQSGTDNIQANLHYLDYWRLKQSEDTPSD